MDQLSPLKEASKDEKDIYQTSVPRKVPLHFIRDTETIKSIQCGELYTLILSTEGNVYTFGCADDGTLGHEETFSAKRVPLKFPATGVSGGDCHGIAYNRENLAFWGRFRNKNGGIGETCHEPTYFNNNHIHNEFYKKAISGANHVLILTEKKNVYAFGSNDSGQIGVSPGKRFHHFQMNKLYEKNVEDIFTGDEYSFLTKYENKTKILKSWGANGNGQLGIGSYQTNIKENVTIYVPTKVLFPGISTVSVKKVCGGSGTSICITEDNRVFVWGLNDFSQLGLKTEEKVIPRPKEIEFFNPYTNPDNTVDDIYSRNQYFYAKNNKLNKVYSWGMGDCYVLGNRKEKSEPTPYLVNHLFFKNLYVKDLALGSAHVVALLIENKDMKIDVNVSENKNKNQQKLVENNSKNKNKNTPRKRVKDESFEENNKKDENFGVLIRVKEEFITLKESDQPKASAKKLLTEKKIIKKDNNNNNSSVDSNTNDEDLLNVIIENKAKKDNKKSLSEKNSSMKKYKESPKKEKEEKVKQKRLTKKEEKTKSPIKNNNKRKTDSKKDNDDYEKIEIDKDEDEEEEEKFKKNLKNTKNQSKNKNKKQIIEEKEEKQEKILLKSNNSNNRRKSSTKKEENVELEKEIYLTRSSRRKTPSSITKEKEKDEQKNNNKILEDKKSKKSTRSSKSTKNQKDEDDNYIPIINDKDIKKNKKTNSSSSKNKNSKKDNENDDSKKDEDISENNINSSRRKYSYPKSNKSPSKKEEVKSRSKNNGEKSKKKSKSKSKDRYPKRK